MESSDLIATISTLACKTFLNPVTLILFMVGFPEASVTRWPEHHEVALKSARYGLFATALTALLLLLNWIAIRTGGAPPAWESFLAGESRWTLLHLGAWLLTLLVLCVFRSGVEWNVMGFIFFPILVLAAVLQTAGACRLGLLAELQALSSLTIGIIAAGLAPVAAAYSQLALWSRLAVEIVLNPLFVLLFNSGMPEGQSSQHPTPLLDRGAAVFVSILMSAFFIVIALSVKWMAFWMISGPVGYKMFWFAHLSSMGPLKTAYTALSAVLLLWHGIGQGLHGAPTRWWRLVLWVTFLVYGAAVVQGLTR